MKKSLLIFFVVSVAFIAEESFAQGITGNWTTASSDGFTPRSDLSACVIGNRIYAMGGNDSLNDALNTFEVYNISTNSWSSPSTIGRMSGRSYFSANVVNGLIYVIGGHQIHDSNYVEFFDPSNNKWSRPVVKGNFKVYLGNTACVVNGMIYVLGHEATTFDVFDPSTSTWSTPTAIGQCDPRSYSTSSVVDGKIYVIGGRNKSYSFSKEVQVFDPSNNQWSKLTPSGTFTPRSQLTSSVIGGKIYVFGGFDGNMFTNTLEVFDPLTNSWSTPATHGVFTGRDGLTSVVAYNEVQRIYVLGGYDNTKYGNTNEIFTPAASSVKQNSSSANISISPNPTSGSVTIQNVPENVSEVLIINILGETVMELKNLHSTDITLDLSKLIRGTYYVKLISSNSVTTKMVVRD